MSEVSRRLWRLRIDMAAWEADLRAATPTARQHAERWRLRNEMRGGLAHDELKATRAQDDGGLDLPGCVKTRIPDPADDDPANSPWGAVMVLANDQHGLYLDFLAFGLRHPDAAGRTPSVYERAHRRLGDQRR